MKKSTQSALLAYAKQLKAENTCDPGAMTVAEFAKESGYSESAASRLLMKKRKKGEVVRVKKLVNGRLVPAYQDA